MKIKFRSKKSLQKRIKLTKSAFKRRHAGNSHLAAHKTNQQKRRLRKTSLFSQGDVNRWKKILNY